MTNVNCSCKIFAQKGRQVWKPTSLRARTEIDASTAWRNLGEKSQNANLHKKRCWKANFDHLWHEKPNLPPCIAHPTQDPPAHIELSFVAKNTKENKKGRRKLTVGPDGPAWTEQQWLWRRTSPCSSPCLSPGRSPSVYLMPCLSPVLRWGQGTLDTFEQHLTQLLDWLWTQTWSSHVQSLHCLWIVALSRWPASRPGQRKTLYRRQMI